MTNITDLKKRIEIIQNMQGDLAVSDVSIKELIADLSKLAFNTQPTADVEPIQDWLTRQVESLSHVPEGFPGLLLEKPKVGVELVEALEIVNRTIENGELILVGSAYHKMIQKVLSTQKETI
jgi:hypothetical protein